MDTLRSLRTTHLYRFPRPVAGTRSLLHQREVGLSLLLSVPCNHLDKRCLIARAVTKFSHPVLISPPILLDVAQQSSSPRLLRPFIILPGRTTRGVSPPIPNFLRQIITADQVLADDCCFQKPSERVIALYSKSSRLPRFFFHGRRRMPSMHVGRSLSDESFWHCLVIEYAFLSNLLFLILLWF